VQKLSRIVFSNNAAIAFSSQFPEKATGVLPVKTARLEISRFLRAGM
jgi:hypothetical protein